MFTLAVPVAIAELGWMSMTVVDTVMVGVLGPAAIGAIGVGNSAFYSFAIFGMGLLLGLDTLVSRSYGAGNREDCHHFLTHAVYLAVLLTCPLMTLFALMPPMFSKLGIVPEVSGLAGSFVSVLSFSTLPLLLYGAFRRYLQGTGHVKPVMFTLVSANLINWFFNWLLIQGHWGFPGLGVTGSALSTCLARLYMAALLAFFVWWFERGTELGFKNMFQWPDLARLALLIRIGLPAAAQILLEIGAFGAAAVLAGRLTPTALAAHQIALNCAAVSFMVPLGIVSAAAVAVGQALGRGHIRAARQSGFIAIGMACLFMACSALAFLFIPVHILRFYTDNASVLKIGTGLLAVTAVFQLFDGIQTVATGALRALAIRVFPCWSIWADTGFSGCQSATCCALIAATAYMAFGGGGNFGPDRDCSHSPVLLGAAIKAESCQRTGRIVTVRQVVSIARSKDGNPNRHAGCSMLLKISCIASLRVRGIREVRPYVLPCGSDSLRAPIICRKGQVLA